MTAGSGAIIEEGAPDEGAPNLTVLTIGGLSA